MQISGSNLLIASQLPAAKPSPPKQGASFSAAVSEPDQGEESFAPLAFKQVSPEPSAPRAQAAPNAGPPAPVGSQLDIRV